MGRIVNLGKEVSVKIPNGAGYKKLYNTTNYASLTQIISVSGSGYLKSAFNALNSSGSYISQIQIAIDGETILNINNTTEPLGAHTAQGVTDQVLFGRDTGGYPVLPLIGAFTSIGIEDSLKVVGSSNILFPSSSEQAASNYGGLLLIPELVRFNEALEISVKKDSSSLVTVCEYYLD